MRRWRPSNPDVRCDIELFIKANHIQVTNEKRSTILITKEMVILILDSLFQLVLSIARSKIHSFINLKCFSVIIIKKLSCVCVCVCAMSILL